MCARHTQFAKTMAGDVEGAAKGKPLIGDGTNGTLTVKQGGAPGTPAVDWEAEGKKNGAIQTDLTDEALKRARKAQALMLSAGTGRRSTFLGGGVDASPKTAKTMLGGY